MNHLFKTAALAACLLFATGCASDGSFINPFDSGSSDGSDGGYEDTTPASPYYISEFPDVPIPNDMGEKTSQSFITYSPTGEKCGVVTYSGRMEVVNLVNTIRRNMTDHGWVLRSMLRSSESVLVYEKDSRVCSIVVDDGLIFSGMKVYMSTRLQGDTGGTMVPYTPGKSSPAPVRSAGTPVATPPAGGQTKLSQ